MGCRGQQGLDQNIKAVNTNTHCCQHNYSPEQQTACTSDHGQQRLPRWFRPPPQCPMRTGGHSLSARTEPASCCWYGCSPLRLSRHMQGQSTPFPAGVGILRVWAASAICHHDKAVNRMLQAGVLMPTPRLRRMVPWWEPCDSKAVPHLPGGLSLTQRPQRRTQ